MVSNEENGAERAKSRILSPMRMPFHHTGNQQRTDFFESATTVV